MSASEPTLCFAWSFGQTCQVLMFPSCVQRKPQPSRGLTRSIPSNLSPRCGHSSPQDVPSNMCVSTVERRAVSLSLTRITRWTDGTCRDIALVHFLSFCLFTFKQKGDSSALSEAALEIFSVLPQYRIALPRMTTLFSCGRLVTDFLVFLS